MAAENNYFIQFLRAEDLRATKLGGFASGLRIRLQSSYWSGLKLSEGWARAGGFASKVTNAAVDFWKRGLSFLLAVGHGVQFLTMQASP